MKIRIYIYIYIYMYIYIKISCTGNKAFWSITLGKFLQKRITINTNHKVKKKKCFLQKQRTNVSKSMQKISPLWQQAEYGRMSPAHKSFCRAAVLLLKGPQCSFTSNIAAYPSETLTRSSGGPSTNKGVGNSIQVHELYRTEEVKGDSDPFFSLPPPQTVIFTAKSVTQWCLFHWILLWRNEENSYDFKAPWGGNVIKSKVICLTHCTRKASCAHFTLAPPGWMQVSWWAA
jgi:hypothetical protein